MSLAIRAPRFWAEGIATVANRTNAPISSRSTGTQEVHIVKQDGERLGMHIKGGLNGQRGNPLDNADEGVFISKINANGAAKRDGRLRVGMRILEVNGLSLLGASHQEAVDALRASGSKLHLVVCKGYEKSDLLHLAGSAGGMSTGLSNNGDSARIGRVSPNAASSHKPGVLTFFFCLFVCSFRVPRIRNGIGA